MKIDMSPTIEAKSDQMNADDLIGLTKTIKVTSVKVIANEQPVSISYEGDNGKPYKPCKTMCRILVMAWGDDGTKYVGRSMTLFRDPDVKWAGKAVGGIRITHMTDLKIREKGIIERLVAILTISKGRKEKYIIEPLILEQKETVTSEGEILPVLDKEVLKEAGLAAAKTGTDSYKAWIATLDKEEKDTVRSNHKTWSKLAKEEDENNEVDDGWK